jgi:ABC-2 type transport system ATP-binding protein
VTVGGVDAVRRPREAREVVGYCPDVGGLIPRATPWEHLQLAARLRRMGPQWQQRAHDLLDRFDLLSAADRVTSGFSHGMGRRLSVVLAAFHEPPVLLLDEPFDGVDPLGVEATLEEVRRARLRGAAVLVSTHLLELAVLACDEAVVLRAGRVVSASPAAELSGAEGAARYRELLS